MKPSERMKRLKKPKKIKIGPYTFEVFFRKPKSKDVGFVSFKKQEISVTPGKLDAMQEVLMHEALHAILWVSGVSAAWDEDEEERLVGALSPYLTTLIKENPEFTNFITKD